MPKIYSLPTSNGSDTLTDLKNDLLKQHKVSLVERVAYVIALLEKYGFQINQNYKNNTIKKLDKELYELRTNDIRIFLYYDGFDLFVLLHGFIKKTQKTPINEIRKAKKEINGWKMIKQEVWSA